MCGGGSVLGTIGKGLTDAVVNPVNQLTSSVTKVFTDPGKANLGDVVSVAVPIGGATLVSDIKHPTDVIGQAAIVGTVAGGAAAYNAYAASPVTAAGSTAAGVTRVAGSGQFISPIAANVSDAAPGSIDAALAGTGSAPVAEGVGAFSAAGPLAPVTPGAAYVGAAGTGTGGFLGSIGSGLSSLGSSLASDAGSVIKGVSGALATGITTGLVNKALNGGKGAVGAGGNGLSGSTFQPGGTSVGGTTLVLPGGANGNSGSGSGNVSPDQASSLLGQLGNLFGGAGSNSAANPPTTGAPGASGMSIYIYLAAAAVAIWLFAKYGKKALA